MNNNALNGNSPLEIKPPNIGRKDQHRIIPRSESNDLLKELNTALQPMAALSTIGNALDQLETVSIRNAMETIDGKKTNTQGEIMNKLSFIFIRAAKQNNIHIMKKCLGSMDESTKETAMHTFTKIFAESKSNAQDLYHKHNCFLVSWIIIKK